MEKTESKQKIIQEFDQPRWIEVILKLNEMCKKENSKNGTRDN